MLGVMSKPSDSAAQWREIVRGHAQSGLSVAAYCRRARGPQSSFYAWRRKLRRSASFTEVRFAEYGRRVNKLEAAADRNEKKGRRTWKRAALEYADLDAAIERGRKALHERPNYVAELERRGRERALIYKTLVLTGLRRGELAALTVGHVELDGPVPYLVLDAADEKAGRGSEVPLRADLADDLRRWVADPIGRRAGTRQSRHKAHSCPSGERCQAVQRAGGPCSRF
jgi:integrase